jgi:hypothetical protein
MPLSKIDTQKSNQKVERRGEILREAQIHQKSIQGAQKGDRVGIKTKAKINNIFLHQKK